jgi:hypothetical protein
MSISLDQALAFDPKNITPKGQTSYPGSPPDTDTMPVEVKVDDAAIQRVKREAEAEELQRGFTKRLKTAGRRRKSKKSKRKTRKPRRRYTRRR